ncbi:endonuclease III domain-containing protein [Thermoproteota archaeon]
MTNKEQQDTLKMMNPPSILNVIHNVSKMLEKNNSEKTTLDQISINWANDPFKILIGTILSQRTKDETTSKVTKQLFNKYGTPLDIAKAPEKEIQQLIYSTGFYRVKARRIKEVSQLILNNFNGKVPNDMASLLSLPSVGRKTANCVLVYGFNIPAIPVDTHVHRISNRLNFVQTRTPDETETRLMIIIDKSNWLIINELFVRFGKSICKPIHPNCIICTLRICCAYHFLKVENSNNTKH